MRISTKFALLMSLLGTIFCGECPEQATYKAAEQGYDQNFIELVEIVYGEGFLSQGGPESVRRMVGELDLAGRKVLDIGCGLGGPSFCLAENHGADVVGIDPQKWMVDQAQRNLAKAKQALSVDFMLMCPVSHLRQFSDASFDVVFSKEALLHIPIEVKQSFFREIYRVLKPGGKIVIMDWLSTDLEYSANTKSMMELDGVAYNLISHAQYSEMLIGAGFSDVSVEDTTEESCALSGENVATIRSAQSDIVEKYSEEVFAEALNSWSWQQQAFQSKELMTAVFRAQKPGCL